MAKLARTIFFPYAASLAGARLAALADEWNGKRRDLVLDYHELRLSAPPELFNENGRVFERVQGHYLPRRLRFVGVQGLKREGLYTHLDDAPLDHAARSLRGMLHWRTSAGEVFYLLINGSGEADLLFSAWRCVSENRSGPEEFVSYVRDWSPAPSFISRRWAETKTVHRRYGGDPAAFRVAGRLRRQQLFVGGLHNQNEKRPAVDAVLNLSEDASRWTTNGQVHLADRWIPRGEGREGMNTGEMIEEANWVIERLRAEQKVLVHCSAGFNRSVSICCAVLILLEGLSAEAALARVREHHPWARPDSHHWLTLRWLAHTHPEAS